MKKLGLIGGLALVVIIAIAVVTAGEMGETSHAFAKGKVVLAPELAEQAKGVHTLFIIMAGPDRPMPLGALRKKLDADAQGTVYEFVLTRDNMQLMGMAEGQPPPEPFKLKARLDVDGAAGPDQPGDLVGEVTGIRLGTEGVEIVINRAI